MVSRAPSIESRTFFGESRTFFGIFGIESRTFFGESRTSLKKVLLLWLHDRMANEIVKFNNQFNSQTLRRFTAMDLDLLMAICSRLKEQSDREVVFTFAELRNLSGAKVAKLSNMEFAKHVVGVNRRLLSLNFEFTNEHHDIIQFALFSKFVTSPEEATLTVRVNSEFAFLLNDLSSQFTRFELAEFVALKSTYAKECYRRLKQFRQTGIWKVPIEDFRRLLDVPKSYNLSDLNKRVLKPIQNELGPLLNLKIHRRYLKKGVNPGRGTLQGFEFEFDPEKVPGRSRPPRVDLSRDVVHGLAERSLQSVTPRLVHIESWGDVWSVGEFDVTAARWHLEGKGPIEKCKYCRMDGRNVEHHGEAGFIS